MCLQDNNAKTVKPAKAAAPKKKEESSDSSESDSESDSDSDEPEKPTDAAKMPLATDKKNRQVWFLLLVPLTHFIKHILI